MVGVTFVFVDRHCVVYIVALHVKIPVVFKVRAILTNPIILCDLSLGLLRRIPFQMNTSVFSSKNAGRQRQPTMENPGMALTNLVRTKESLF